MQLNVKRAVSNIYARLFSKPLLAGANEALLRASLKARGYNNYSDHRVSGEAYFLKTVLPKIRPAICIDVGANVGDFSRQLLIETEAVVYAFEPLEALQPQLAELASQFGDRFIPVEKAAGSENCFRKIRIDPDRLSQSSLSEDVNRLPFVNTSKEQAIEVVTLDSFFEGTAAAKSIDFIKIDTEGYEYEVVVGAQSLVAEAQPKMIQFESNWHHLFQGVSVFAISRLLQDYRLFQLMPNHMVERDPEAPLSNIFQFANFVFIRNDIVQLVR